MSEARQLVYDFLTLPHYVRCEIVKELGLTMPDDNPNLADTELHVEPFRRAREAGKLDLLRVAVQKAKEERKHDYYFD